MKQTAVEWLMSRFEDGDMYNVEDAQFIKHQALKMEKQQITDAICEGIQQFVVEFNEAKNTFTISYPDPNMIAEQYYNETYKGGEQ